MKSLADSGEISVLLDELQHGDQTAFNRLFRLVYEQLNLIAHIERQKWDGDFTVNTTALVHEAYEKLLQNENRNWESRKHFFRVAGRAMRQIISNYSRDKKAQKRGGQVEKVSLENNSFAPQAVLKIDDDQALVFIALEEALKDLEKVSERLVKIVECRFYIGLEIKETAAVLGISEASVKRGWVTARAWLFDALH